MSIKADADPLKVLLIADNLDDAGLITAALEDGCDRPIKVEPVLRLKVAFERLTDEKFDAVLLDLSLPEASGVDALIKLRNFSTEIPVVVITGLEDKELALQCLKNGAQDYLIKGVPGPESVYRAITYAIERCRAEAAIKQIKLFKQREEFIAMLAHDLRSPISGSDRIISIMMEGLSGPVSEKQNQLLSMVSGTNKTLLLMINNVLDSYKLDAGGETFNGALIDLGAVINECVRDAESLASEKEIQIHQVITCRHSVYADSLAMRRVIANLLSNAIKFTGRGGTIEARFEELQGSAVMSIKDTGIGISSEHLPHLFERFYQADSMNRAVGLGLGLHLCKQLVEGQNGTITCVSEPKRGTTFAVRLPLAFEEKAQALIIDDNAANQLTLQRILKFLAVESIAVSSGQEALKAVAAHPFQAIFMDISMPDMDGYRVSKAMREAGQTMPIIAFTGLQNIDPKKMAEVGINDVIYKPVDIATVRQAVKQWMPGCELR